MRGQSATRPLVQRDSPLERQRKWCARARHPALWNWGPCSFYIRYLTESISWSFGPNPAEGLLWVLFNDSLVITVTWNIISSTITIFTVTGYSVGDQNFRLNAAIFVLSIVVSAEMRGHCLILTCVFMLPPHISLYEGSPAKFCTHFVAQPSHMYITRSEVSRPWAWLPVGRNSFGTPDYHYRL
jgi:hypothetical protein